MQLFEIFVLELGRLAAEVFEQFADEGAGTGGRIEDFHILVDQVAAEVLFAQPVGRLDHEAHDLVRRVDDAEPVGRLRVVDLVEVLVDDLEEGLLLVVAADLAGRGADRAVVDLQRFERLELGVAGEERRFELVQLARDVVVVMERRARKHDAEDFLGQDVLDQNLAHVRRSQRGVDRFLRLLEEFLRCRAERRVVRVRLCDACAQ